MSPFPPHRVGLALSGGGSRAAGFHRGTVEALAELGLLEAVDVVSTVSGGSLFGGAWLAAQASGTAVADFLGAMRRELASGFILRSARPRLLMALCPGVEYSRTDLIADTFDRIFFHGRRLADLPARPTLCINTTLLNDGQVAKFSRDGFSAWGLRVPGAEPSHVVPWGDFPLALAVAASAAFPVGLPPLQLGRGRFPHGTEFTGSLEGATRLALSDGGVLENLGIQSLLVSRRFAAWDLIVSDAGTRDEVWSPSPVLGALKGLFVWAMSGRILDRLMLVMNDKQNRWARQHVVETLERSWLADAVRHPTPGQPAMEALLAGEPARPRRDLLFVRVAQTWDSFLRSVPHHRLVEIAVAAGGRSDEAPGPQSDAQTRLAFLESAGVDLERARERHARLGGDAGATAMNDVATNLTALSGEVLDRLADHAAWQVHAGFAVYGFGSPDSPTRSVTRNVPELSGGAIGVPVVVDDVKDYPGFSMTRCSYFVIECDEPAPDWTLTLQSARIPFLMLGLSGIVVSPPSGRPHFERPGDFDALFEAVEGDDRLYVDLNDIWLPNECFDGGRPERSTVFRIGQRFFAEALAYRGSLTDAERFIAAARDLRDEIEPSPAESEAFRAWSRSQIDGARRQYEQRRGEALGWEPDPLYPDEDEAR